MPVPIPIPPPPSFPLSFESTPVCLRRSRLLRGLGRPQILPVPFCFMFQSGGHCTDQGFARTGFAWGSNGGRFRFGWSRRYREGAEGKQKQKQKEEKERQKKRQKKQTGIERTADSNDNDGDNA